MSLKYEPASEPLHISLSWGWIWSYGKAIPRPRYPKPSHEVTNGITLRSPSVRKVDSRQVIDSGLIGSTDFHSSNSGRGTARAEDAQGTPTQSHISPSILVYEEKHVKKLGIGAVQQRIILYHETLSARTVEFEIRMCGLARNPLPREEMCSGSEAG